MYRSLSERLPVFPISLPPPVVPIWGRFAFQDQVAAQAGRPSSGWPLHLRFQVALWRDELWNVRLLVRLRRLPARIEWAYADTE